METKIQKWGNSLGVRLPKNITQNKSLKDGSRVLVSESDNKIIIESIVDETQSLSGMLKKITDNNIHKETEWGASKGNEVW